MYCLKTNSRALYKKSKTQFLLKAEILAHFVEKSKKNLYSQNKNFRVLYKNLFLHSFTKIDILKNASYLRYNQVFIKYFYIYLKQKSVKNSFIYLSEKRLSQVY